MISKQIFNLNITIFCETWTKVEAQVKCENKSQTKCIKFHSFEYESLNQIIYYHDWQIIVENAFSLIEWRLCNLNGKFSREMKRKTYNGKLQHVLISWIIAFTRGCTAYMYWVSQAKPKAQKYYWIVLVSFELDANMIFS